MDATEAGALRQVTECRPKGPWRRLACQPAARERRMQMRGKRTGELLLVEVTDDAGPLDEADLAGLLGNDDRERVGLLGDAKGGLMAGAEALERNGRFDGRQQRPGRQDSVTSNHDRSVMQRRPGREDRHEQIGRYVGVEHDAVLGYLLKPRFSLEHDESSVALARHSSGSAGNFSGDVGGSRLLGRRTQPAEGAQPADPIERPAKLRLEDHDESEKPDVGARLQNLRQEAQVQG